MTTVRQGKGRGVLLVLGAGLLWSTVALGVRLVDDASAAQIVFFRALVQVPVLLVVLVSRYGWRMCPVFRAVGWNGIWGAVALAISYLAGVSAITMTSVGNALFVFSTAPLLTALIARVVLKERLKRATWFAMSLAALGVALMTASAMGAGQMAGNLTALLSSLGYALFTVSLRKGRDIDMLPTIVLSGVFVAIMSAVVAGGDLTISAHDFAISSYLGAVAMGLGLILYTAGSKTLNAAELPLIAMVEVVLGPIWVWLFLGESMNAVTIIGGVVVLSAVLIQALFGFRRQRLPIGFPT